jgi:hypothetical protein
VTGGLYVNGVVARYSKAAISLRGQETWNQVGRGNLAVRNVAIVQTDGVFQTVDETNANLENRQFALDLAENAIEEVAGETAALFTALPTTSASTGGSAFDWTPAASSPLRTGGMNDFAALPTQLRNATTANGQAEQRHHSDHLPRRGGSERREVVGGLDELRSQLWSGSRRATMVAAG